jgi:hypothetical protein
MVASGERRSARVEARRKGEGKSHKEKILKGVVLSKIED